MRVLIGIELTKLFSRVSTYVVFLISIGIAVLNLATNNSATSDTVLHSYAGVSTILIFSAIIINTVMSDVHKGTMKYTVGAGNSRESVFASKLIASVIGVLVLDLVHIIMTVIFGFVKFEGYTFGGQELFAVAFGAIALVLYTILLVAISFLISGSFGSALTIIISVFLPMASVATLLENPIVSIITGAEPTYLVSTIVSNGFAVESVIQLACVSVLFIAFAMVSMFVFKKQEIK